MGVYPVSVSDRTEPLDVCDAALCETCRHCVIVTDRASSVRGMLRVLEVCVADHDRTGEDWGDVIDGPVTECGNYERTEG